MSQTTEATNSTFTSLDQWNPVEILKINFEPNGLIFCCGITVSSGEPCGWQLDKRPIHDLLTQISNLSPQIATKSLFSLAKLVLCHHHQSQLWGLQRTWTKAINHLSPTPSGLDPVELDGSSPPHQLKDVKLAALSLPGTDLSSGSSQLCNQPHQSQNNHLGSHNHCAISEGQLLQEVKSLRTEFKALEIEFKNKSNSSNIQNASRWPWSRVGSGLKAFYRKHRTAL